VPVVARLTDIEGGVDLVDVFRRAVDMPRVVDDAIAAQAKTGIKTLWMQLGIANEAEARRALDAGLDVVMDRCMMAEHRRCWGSLPVYRTPRRTHRPTRLQSCSAGRPCPAVPAQRIGPPPNRSTTFGDRVGRDRPRHSPGNRRVSPPGSLLHQWS
jgi:hypothetical protein